MSARAVVPLLAALAIAALPASAAGASCARERVPSLRAVTGTALGAAPIAGRQAGAYLRAVDRASDRVRAGVLGRSTEGRPIPYAVVSSPRNLARLDAVAARLRAVRAGQAGGLPDDQPAIVWLTGSVHGNEPSGADADLAVLRELASGAHCDALTRLVVVVVPVQNPDGRAAGARVSATGFDLNRDWFALTQPETTAVHALQQRLPPVALVDQHEQGGDRDSVPPNAAPILPTLPPAARRAIDHRFGPALRRALPDGGEPLDLLFPGYADAAASTRFGAAGLTIEVGAAQPYARRVAQQAAAARAVVAVAVRDRAALLEGWASVWRTPAGGPTAVLHPSADAAALVARLRGDGVRVARLTRDVAVTRLRPYDDVAGPATLPAGAWAVPTDQPLHAWVTTLLAPDAGGGQRSAVDDTSWSRPLLMGLRGGWTDASLPADALDWTAADVPPPPPPGAGAYAFAGDSVGGLGLALDLLARGATVARTPGSGELTVTGIDAATLAPLAAAQRVTVSAASATAAAALRLVDPRAPAITARHASAAAPVAAAVPHLADPRPPATTARHASRAARRLAAVDAVDAGAAETAPAPVPLRLPRVALLGDLARPVHGPPGVEDSADHASHAWTRFALTRRLGLAVTELSARELAAGALTSGGFTALVVADGRGTLDAPALAQVAAFVRGGGTYVGIGELGLATAGGAGIAAAAYRPTARSSLPGPTFAMTVDTSDPLGWGAGPTAFVLDAADPLLAPGAGTPVVSHADPVRRVAGWADPPPAAAGSPVVVDAVHGAGRVALFATDPSYRGYVEGAQRLLVNALLAPAPPASAGTPRSAGSRRSAPRR